MLKIERNYLNGVGKYSQDNMNDNRQARTKKKTQT